MTQLFAPMLVVGAIALYVFDSAMMLYGNEFVLTRRAGRWRLARPGAMEFSSRRLYIPNPLTPHRAHFRLHWSVTPSPAPDAALPAQEDFLKAASRVGVAVLPLLVVLAVGPLLVALGFAAPEQLLAWMSVSYLSAICLLLIVYRSRDALGLSRRRFAALAGESLLCVPFALNLLRKISEVRGPAGDPMKFAFQVLDDADRQHLLDSQEAMRTRLQ